MYRDIFTNKWIIGGIVFLIMFAVVCVLWYRYDTAFDRQAAADSEKELRQLQLPEVTQESVYQTGQMETVQNKVSIENKPDPSNREVDQDVVLKDVDSESFSSESPLTAENAEDVRVSPHGFGPYPELPPKWDPDTWIGLDADGELLVRVWLKLEEQGMPIVGATVNGGQVYPTLENTVYIQWKDIPDTNERIVSSYSGDPRAINLLCGIQDGSDMPPNFMRVISRNILEGNVPPDVTIIDGTNPGIDAYNFLNLQRR